MKKILLLLFIGISVFSFAQSNVKLNINHKLGSSDFQFDMASSNSLHENFKVTRLEYYLSDISVHHDGMEESIPDVIALVNVANGTMTQIDLGTLDFTNIEAISFHIGVNSELNHLDPSQYSPTHPLAPKSPSMHWGWASGYRFVAMEGTCGTKFKETFQLHALGDKNYFKNTFPVTKTVDGDDIILNVDADYSRFLSNIKISSGLIVHSENEEAQQLLKNVISDNVFVGTKMATNVSDFEVNNTIQIAPNPIENGYTTIQLDSKTTTEFDAILTNVLGETIEQFKLQSNNAHTLYIQNSGVYFLNLIQDGKIVITKKIVSK